MEVAVAKKLIRVRMMLLGLLFQIIFLITFGCKEQPQLNYILSQPSIVTSDKVDHHLWNNLLIKYVDDNGVVNYEGFKSEETTLITYLQQLAEHPPQANWTKNDSLSYYINAYNAHTIKLILDHYPLKSIKDIRNPWDQKRVQIGKDVISLGDIEHEILREMGETRIHFAINCASYSCPKLRNEAYLPSKLDEQLNRAATDFINDSTKNKLKPSQVYLSKIFKWYDADFTEKGSLIEYLNKFANVDIQEGAKIKYLDYDWSLNTKK